MGGGTSPVVPAREWRPGLAWCGAALGLATWLALGSAAWAQRDGSDVVFDPEKPRTDAYREAIERDDAGRRQEAMERGESFSPTFDRPTRPDRPPPAAMPGAEAPEPQKPAPALVEETPPPERPAEAQGRTDPPAARLGERLPDRKQKQERDASPLDALLDVLAAPRAKMVWVAHERPQAEEESGADPGFEGRAEGLPPVLAGLKPGAGLYARALYEANSDFPGPVILEVLEPPLDGAVATGEFDRVRDRLVIRIDRLSVGRESWDVEGWAVDPGCACYGIEGEVDRHWFERVLLPSAVAFAGGFLEAAAQTARIVTRGASGETVTVESQAPSHRQQVYAGAAAAARSAGEVLLEGVPQGPTVRVPVNTELVLVITGTPERAGNGEVAVSGREIASSRRSGPAARIDNGQRPFAGLPVRSERQ